MFIDMKLEEINKVIPGLSQDQQKFLKGVILDYGFASHVDSHVFDECQGELAQMFAEDTYDELVKRMTK